MHFWPGALQLHWPGAQQQGDYAKHTDDAGDAVPSRIFLEDRDKVPTGLGVIAPKSHSPMRPTRRQRHFVPA
jgi:hypothetical protein